MDESVLRTICVIIGFLFGLIIGYAYKNQKYWFEKNKWKNTPAYISYEEGRNKGFENGFEEGKKSGYKNARREEWDELETAKKEFQDLQAKFWKDVDKKITE